MLSISEVVFGRELCPLFSGAFRVVAIDMAHDLAALVRLELQRPHGPVIFSWSALMHCIERGEIDRNQEFALDIASSDSELTKDQLAELHRVEEYFIPLLRIGISTLILDSEKRNEEFAVQCARVNVSVRTIRRHFNLYLWGGLNRYALIGEKYSRPCPQVAGSARRGGKGVSPSIPVVRKALEEGCKEFYLSNKFGMTDAYVSTLKKFFHIRIKQEDASKSYAKLKDLLLNEESLPTLRQFRYVCDYLGKSRGTRRPSRETAQSATSTNVPLGKARDNVPGPGFRWEIDATRFQVQLVSQFGRRYLAGEATGYCLVDVYTGAYTGWAVSPGAPSWDLGRVALLNAFTDKTPEFERLGLDYTSEDMPVRELPTGLTIDRGEFKSIKASPVPDLGIIVEVMAPMRPDRKGLIESAIGALKNRRSFYVLPGSHVKNPGRRVDDGKMSACLTIHELERIYVEKLIDLNLEPIPLRHIPPELIDEGYESITHIGFYKWALENRPGYYRTMSPIEVFTFLLNKADTSATSAGIRFRKMTFRSPRLKDLGFAGESKPIRIGYTGRADHVWFYDEQACELVVAENDNEELRRARATFQEAELFFREAEAMRQTAKLQNVHRRMEKAPRINQKTKGASDEARELRRPLTKAAAKREIRKNQAVDRYADRVRRSDQEKSRYATTAARPTKAVKPKELVTPVPQETVRESINKAWETMG